MSGWGSNRVRGGSDHVRKGSGHCPERVRPCPEGPNHVWKGPNRRSQKEENGKAFNDSPHLETLSLEYKEEGRENISLRAEVEQQRLELVNEYAEVQELLALVS